MDREERGEMGGEFSWALIAARGLDCGISGGSARRALISGANAEEEEEWWIP
jgi:hypothetical protein